PRTPGRARRRPGPERSPPASITRGSRDEAMTHGREEQVKPWVTPADLLTALRLPLAAAFPFVQRPALARAVGGAAAASDFFGGMLARRFGGSRTGAMLDPIADKSFMAVAFLTVARSGSLYPLEIAGVLARDIVAALGYVGAWLWRGALACPPRGGGQGGAAALRPAV